MFDISPEIYNGTLFEGLPCKLRYYDSRPKIIYQSYKDGTARYSNYASWHNLYDGRKITQTRVLNLFTHDLSHATLYMLRGEIDRLEKNEFGLTWDKVDAIANGPEQHFKCKRERLDEYRIMHIHDQLFQSMFKKAPITPKDHLDYLVRSARNTWHTKKIYDLNGNVLPDVLKTKREELDKCSHEMYYGYGVSTIRDAARSLVKYYKERL